MATVTVSAAEENHCAPDGVAVGGYDLVSLPEAAGFKAKVTASFSDRDLVIEAVVENLEVKQIVRL